MADQEVKDDLVSTIVAAYATRPDVTADDIVELTRKLQTELSQPPAPEGNRGQAAAAPVLPVDEAVTHDQVFCLECGKGFSMLKRHIGAEHGLSEHEYRLKYGIHETVPLVAPEYSARKARHARRSGLGKHSRKEG